ncbi:glycosyltransferase family 9 protein [Dyadobacter sp. LHD-138]|uniref:glycosyltransferase family 9 protein n=1 Tax=Dyadobacter sp. LHD-138 TaxID=3071413 RepID=UPI0027E1B16D|nr:glycosyltransferase family 9 protein [Dyadobacter sp. LHD-138]MDQ6480361.1 glycosyltransferase family 9 protein [Dyadobacter sp. LHD-138]
MLGKKLKILVSRTDAIGDVILTIPICDILKENIEVSELHFLGRSYTEDVIRTCSVIDKFVNIDLLEKLDYAAQVQSLKDENYDAIIHVLPNIRIARLAKDAKIPIRIGTTNRWFHWMTCNRLVQLSRKKSDLHEAQLNLKLLKALEIEREFSLESIFQHFKLSNIAPLPQKLYAYLQKDRLNIILHPKSNKSAREWGLQNFADLINLLPREKYRIFISGTKAEGALMRDWLHQLPEHVIDVTGMMTLKEFISFIYHSNGLIAASTGPLHVAAALGNNALGLYPPMRPIFPQRWAPIGPKASFLVGKTNCNKCQEDVSKCECMNQISPKEVASVIRKWEKSADLVVKILP